EQGHDLAETIMRTDHTDWWFQGPDRSWWENKNGGRKPG
ncbi:MAG: phosphohydrolase, partial [Desulfovibrionaceae bacterium]|nr:phosphohydrolase [Desulfovibrionaceae bacterium]